MNYTCPLLILLLAIQLRNVELNCNVCSQYSSYYGCGMTAFTELGTLLSDCGLVLLGKLYTREGS